MAIIDMSDCPKSYRYGRYGGQAGDKNEILYNKGFRIIEEDTNLEI